MNGLLLVDKPAGVTSHDVVDMIRRASGLRRIGHTGTLDPGATGLLVLCLGQATRLSEYLTGLDKVYEGRMKLGVVTESYDLDGAVTEEHPVPALTSGDIQRECDRFVGEIQQVPPMMSAVKVGGKRLYKMARKGEVIERQPRPVQVHDFTVTSWEPPFAGLCVKCGSGTYVRSLCHEVGQSLGCGAALASLRRTVVGPYSVDQAGTTDAFTDPGTVAARLIPMDDALTMPSVTVDGVHEAVVMTGGAVSCGNLDPAALPEDGLIQIKNCDGRLLAIAVARASAMGLRAHPKRVFPRED